MNEFSLIGIVGPQASGKTEVAKKLVDLGAARVRMGDIVWDEVKRRNLEISEDNVGKVANELREEEGPDAVAKRCIPIIEKKGKNNRAIVVDGIRSLSEVERFQEEFGRNFKLISVESPLKERYSRIKNRKRKDDTKSFEEFKDKEERESKWGVEKASNESDYLINNDQSLTDLKKETKEIFKDIMKDKHEN